ncbi:hypothetical protein [Endozoicomonas ascidiicola]|uniref:hypothetical protein n=1 Tax=Endozoicomonas ascidiicola TaxID=1698521 RepID=UPI00082B1D68|nr:hypothetical protein [Endozoicomonas ascidiicola]
MSPDLQAITNIRISDLSAKSGEELLKLVDSAEKQLVETQRARDWLESAIAYKYVYRSTNIRSELGQEFGFIHFEDGAVKVTSEIPKAITWDQKKLAAIAETIRNQGENPEEFMEVQYTVLDARFDEWPEVMQNAFRPALTIEQGTSKYRLSPNYREVRR